MTDLEIARSFAQDIADLGGRTLFVGGYARDSILRNMGKNISSKDIDIEVYGVTLEWLTDVLSQYGEINIVGASFGVIKLGHTKIDISLPRKDSKDGRGHKGFIVDTDPDMSISDAALRRDFTINTIAIDVLTHETIDHYGGVADLQRGLLRVTDPRLFADDPLRVLRGMQLAARFDLKITDDTVSLCQTIDLHDLPAERIGEEWRKLLLMSTRPSIGMEIAMITGALQQLHPALAVLWDVPQDSRWHPEGNVWEHTKLAADVARMICQREKLDEQQSLTLMFAAICHDLGKASTTSEQDGHITSHSHEQAGVQPTINFLQQLAVPKNISEAVLPLVVEHMFPVLHQKPSDAALRRLSYRLHPASIHQLLHVAEADIMGRSSTTQSVSHLADIKERARHLHIGASKPPPIIQGRDLIRLGMTAGPEMGRVLDELYQKQLSGIFNTHDEGLRLLDEITK